MRNFVDRIRWSVVFAGKPPSPWRHLLSKRQSVAACTELPSASEELALANVAADLFEEGRRARNARSGPPRCPQVVREGFRLLRESRFAAVLTDKDGGYCLVDKEELYSMHLDTMGSDNYTRSRTAVDSLCMDILGEFVLLVRSMPGFSEDPTWVSAMLSDVSRNSPLKIVSTLQSTVKTHKPPGAVTLRAIHATTGSPLAPAMRFVSHCLRPVVHRIPHLMKDSGQLTNLIDSTPLPASCRFYKVDIKEFFMSGVHGRLVELCAKHVALDLRDSFIKVASFVLSSQYVQVSGCNDVCWKVRKGSGMGVSCAGDLSNVSFWELAERDTLVDETFRGQHGIVFYARYADDLMIVTDGSSLLDCWDLVKLKSEFFSLKVESVSSAEVRMLDVLFFKGRRFASQGRLDYIAAVKATSVAAPLLPSSCHHPAIHWAWPRGQVTRVVRLSSSRDLADEALAPYHHTWARHGVLLAGEATRLSIPHVRTFRFIIPAVPLYLKAKWRRPLTRFAEQWSALSLEPIRCGIAWKLGGVHLFRTLKRMHGSYNGSIHRDPVVLACAEGGDLG